MVDHPTLCRVARYLQNINNILCCLTICKLYISTTFTKQKKEFYSKNIVLLLFEVCIKCSMVILITNDNLDGGPSTFLEQKIWSPSNQS